MERLVSNNGVAAGDPSARGRGAKGSAVVRAARVGAALVLAVSLSGCSMMRDLGLDFGLFGGDESEEAMAVADAQGDQRPDYTDAAKTPPSFAVGDRFTFDNPRATWTVKEVSGDRVRWVADSGAEQVTAMNPLLPALSWTSERQGEGRRLISDMSAPFFPLEVGKTVTFTATVSTDKPPYAWEFTWRCEVLGTERVEVQAGTFGTYRIACGRKRPDELVFNYAPAVGHYVRMASTPQPGGKTAVRDLIEFRSRQYIAFVDPKTAAMSQERGMEGAMAQGGEMADMPPASLQAAEPEMGAEIDERALSEPDATDSDGPVLVMGEGSAPQSGLTREGAAKRERAARKEATRPEPSTQSTTGSTGGSGTADAAGGADRRTARAATVPEGMTRADALPDGSVAIHLASYKNPANVETGWRRLTEANGDLLGNVRPLVRQVTLSGKGTYQRLLAGPLASMKDAEALCAALKKRDVYCDPMQL